MKQSVECLLQWVAPQGQSSKIPTQKAIICVWWDWEGMVHREMLETNAAVNKELYDAQLHLENGTIRLKDQAKSSCSTSHLALMLQKSSKPYTKSLNGRFFSINYALGPCANRLPPFPLSVKPNPR